MRDAQTFTSSLVRSVVHAAIGGAALACVACGSEADVGSNAFSNSVATQAPGVGLYVPGSAAGKPQPIEADGNYTKAELAAFKLREGMGSGGCTPPTLDMGWTVDQVASAKAASQDLSKRPHTSGSLSMTFMTKSLGGKWHPANVGAVWVQDIQQRAVKRLEVWAADRVSSLAFYNQNTCRDYADVVATATLPDHSKLHHDAWDTKDFLGNVVPDGTYVIWIEVADVEDITAPPTTFQFEKGAVPLSMSVPTTDGTVGLQYTYTPTATAAGGNTKP